MMPLRFTPFVLLFCFCSFALLRAPAAAAEPDWGKRLTLRTVETAAGERHAAPGGVLRLQARVANESDRPLSAPARIEVRDGRNELLMELARPLRVEARGEEVLAFDWNTAGVPSGVYEVVVVVDPPSGKGKATAQVSALFALAGEHDLFLLLEREPHGRGLELDRNRATSQRVKHRDRVSQAWVARAGSSELAWGRAFRLKVTDPRFLEGAMPAVDLELSFRQTADTGVRVFMDTASGPREVAFGWGRSTQFRRVASKINDAFLGARTHGGDSKEPLDGHDLRINSYNEDLALRYVFLRGYPRKGEVDFTRLLVFEGVEASRPVFAFPRGSTDALRHTLWNNSLEPVALDYVFEFKDWNGREVDRVAGRMELGAEGREASAYSLRTEGLAQGVYRLTWTARDAGKPDAEPYFSRTTNLAVISDRELPKAGEGEFLYGIDVSLGRFHQNKRLMEWIGILGADITRGLGQNMSVAQPERLDQALRDLEARGLRSMQMEWPPAYVPEAAKRRAANEKLAAELESFARANRGRVTYYELGNEPDLTFFYPGPIEAYIEAYETMARAIKRGNPDAIVMNGGLCFFGEEGRTRAREFVRRVDPATIDAWAYHAHGAGVEAERKGLGDMTGTAAEFGKAEGKLFIDTESGMAARTDHQQWVQARTAIQKMVLAQSERMPVFFFFRLYMQGGDGAYTMIEDYQQPRPVVPAYRAMVEALRGLSFRSKLDLGDAGAEAFLFASKDGRRRALVSWNNRDAVLSRNLALGADASGLSGVRRMDMMGNVEPLAFLDGAVVGLEISADPVFVLWETSAPDSPVTALPSALRAPRVLQIVSGETTPLRLEVAATGRGATEAEVLVRSLASGGVGVSPERRAVRIAEGERASLSFDVRADKPRREIEWPAEWTVFLDVNLEPAAVAALDPASPRPVGKSGPLAPRVMVPRERKLDFAAAAGGASEGRIAFATAALRSAREQELTIGASADWWMACFVNGEQVYSTWEAGNGSGQSITAHQFPVRLRAGENHVSFLVRSGSQGWSLLSGGPAELAAERGGGQGEALEVELRRAGRVIGRETVNLVRAVPPRAWSGGLAELVPARVSAWEPNGEFSPVRLRNFFEAHPDSDRWYGGATDLSGRVWLLDDATHAYVLLAVRDDAHVAAGEGVAPEKADGAELALADAEGRPIAMLGLAPEAGGLRITGQNGRGKADGDVARLAEPRLTVYRVRIPKAPLGESFRLNLRLRDSDGEGLKQTLVWMDGWDGERQEPALWYQWTAAR